MVVGDAHMDNSDGCNHKRKIDQLSRELSPHEGENKYDTTLRRRDRALEELESLNQQISLLMRSRAKLEEEISELNVFLSPKLPNELWCFIFSFLDIGSWSKTSQVCRLWNELTWLSVQTLCFDFKKLAHWYVQTYGQEESQKRMEDLLQFFSTRCPNLKKFKEHTPIQCATFHPRQMQKIPKTLTSLTLNNREMDGELPFLPNLKRLDLCKSDGIVARGLDSLSDKLVRMNLGFVSFIPNSILLSLPKSLTALDLRNTSINDQDLKHLPRNLKSLRLDCTGVAMVPDLPATLKFLSLWDCNSIMDETIAHLPRNLVGLDLSFTNVTDQALSYLPSSIKVLGVCHCKKFTSKFPASIPSDVIISQLLMGFNQFQYATVIRSLPTSIKYLDVAFSYLNDWDIINSSLAVESMCIYGTHLTKEALESMNINPVYDCVDIEVLMKCMITQ